MLPKPFLVKRLGGGEIGKDIFSTGLKTLRLPTPLKLGRESDLFHVFSVTWHENTFSHNYLNKTIASFSLLKILRRPLL